MDHIELLGMHTFLSQKRVFMDIFVGKNTNAQLLYVGCGLFTALKAFM